MLLRLCFLSLFLSISYIFFFSLYFHISLVKIVLYIKISPSVFYLYFHKNEPSSASFPLIFGLSIQRIQNFQHSNVKILSSIRYWDSNSQPLERQDSPITTRHRAPVLLLPFVSVPLSHSHFNSFSPLLFFICQSTCL